MPCVPSDDLKKKDGWHWVRKNGNPPRLTFWHAGAAGWDVDDGYTWPEHLPEWIYDRPATAEDLALAFPNDVKKPIHMLY